MSYADYTYYKDIYKGTVLDTASFDKYAMKATQKIKLHTFNRIPENNIIEEAKMCCCELAEAVYKHEAANDGRNISAEKVGDYSVSYVDKEKQEQIYQSKTNEIIASWLASTGLLYRGCL